MEKKVAKNLINTLKAFLYTTLVLILIYGIYSLVALSFSNMSIEQSNTWIIISMCMGIIFTIFICTFAILDAIEDKISRSM